MIIREQIPLNNIYISTKMPVYKASVDDWPVVDLNIPLTVFNITSYDFDGPLDFPISPLVLNKDEGLAPPDLEGEGRILKLYRLKLSNSEDFPYHAHVGNSDGEPIVHEQWMPRIPYGDIWDWVYDPEYVITEFDSKGLPTKYQLISEFSQPVLTEYIQDIDRLEED